MPLYEKLQADTRFVVPFKPQLDIVVYAVKAPTASASSRLAKEIFDQAAKQNLHLALAALPAQLFQDAWPDLDWDQDTVTCLRSCLMKPEHLTYIDEIWGILSSATDSLLLPR